MNKTIIININGIVFHIEEDAYEVLKSYMTDVKRHFIDSADSLEITTDIENRLAEMFNEILARESKQVIVEQDVKAVIAQMGTVEDFASAESDEPVAAPFKDPFAYNTASRRLFRDPDDHLVAGVCAGIANYFDMQAIWIRLAFAVAFCFFGTGLFLYAVLWIVIPKAISRADRMAMKGEKLDLQGFKRNFEDEMKNIHGSVTGLHKDAKPFIYKTRDFTSDIFEHVGTFGRGAGSVLVKLIGVGIILTCIGFIIALLVAVFTYFAYGRDNLSHLFPFEIVDRDYSLSFMFGSFFVLALPLVGIMLLAARLVFNRTTITKSAGISLLLCWIAAICVVTYYSIKVAADFKAGSKFTQNVNIAPTPNNTYTLKLNNARYLTAADSAALDIKNNFAGKIILDDDDNYNNLDGSENGQRKVHLYIERADVSQPILVESFAARGRSYAEALGNARDITYQFTQVNGVLTFDRYLQRPSSKPYRGQELYLTLRLPVNAKLMIDPEMDDILRDVNIWQCNADNKVDNDRPATFIMTPDGLECKVDTLVTIPKQKMDTIVVDTLVKAKK